MVCGEICPRPHKGHKCSLLRDKRGLKAGGSFGVSRWVVCGLAYCLHTVCYRVFAAAHCLWPVWLGMGVQHVTPSLSLVGYQSSITWPVCLCTSPPTLVPRLPRCTTSAWGESSQRQVVKGRQQYIRITVCVCNVQAQRSGIVLATYEARPNPADHKSKGHNPVSDFVSWCMYVTTTCTTWLILWLKKIIGLSYTMTNSITFSFSFIKFYDFRNGCVDMPRNNNLFTECSYICLDWCASTVSIVFSTPSFPLQQSLPNGINHKVTTY